MPQIGKVAHSQSPQFTLPSTTKPPSFLTPNYKDTFLDTIKARDERIAKEKADKEAKLAAIEAEKAQQEHIIHAAAATAPSIPTTVYHSDDYYVNWIIQHESGGDPNNVNPSSGACGLFQKVPCNVPLGNVTAQMADGLQYINSRYGGAYNAYLFWIAHGWY